MLVGGEGGQGGEEAGEDEDSSGGVGAHGFLLGRIVNGPECSSAVLD